MNPAELIAQETGDLPSLPLVATKVLERVRDPKVTPTELEQIVSQDQALVAKLLRIANSAMFGLRAEVSSVRRAIVVLGFNTLRSVVMAAATQPLMQAKRSSLKEFMMWEHSLAVAVGARLIAEKTGYGGTEEAFVAGLIHDVGKVVLDTNLGDAYQPIIDRVLKGEQTFIEAEQETLGFDHTDVGRLVAEKWNLPVQLQEAVHLHHRATDSELDKQLCATVSLANSIVVKLAIGPERRPDIDLESLEAVHVLQLAEGRSTELMEQIREAIVEQEHALFGGVTV